MTEKANAMHKISGWPIISPQYSTGKFNDSAFNCNEKPPAQLSRCLGLDRGQGLVDKTLDENCSLLFDNIFRRDSPQMPINEAWVKRHGGNGMSSRSWKDIYSYGDIKWVS